MTPRALLTTAIVALACASSGGRSAPDPEVRVFDAGVTFSPSLNPVGVWQYGSTVGPVLTPSAFRRDQHHQAESPVEFWQPTAANHFPYVAGQRSGATVKYGTRSFWALRAGQLAMEASNSRRPTST